PQVTGSRRQADRRPPPHQESNDVTGGTTRHFHAGTAPRQRYQGLTGKSPEGVTGVEPTEDGWLVSVEVLEDRRVPSSGDILALYEAELDPDGALLAYRRARRYSRNHSVDEREASR
ncbi:MAG TPA: gas vesicle protein GvpO, partial [Streptosporangiaceae bacterium]|nr:gas vesicle protein GvpO [Streptosporangiaceae bacterium]